MRKSFGSKLVEQSSRRDSNRARNNKIAVGILSAVVAGALATTKNNKKVETDFSDKAKKIIDKNIIAMKYLQDK